MGTLNSKFFLSLVGIVVSATIILIVAYAWLVPGMFREHKTYSVFIAGIGGAAVVSGYYSYRTAGIIESVVPRFLFASLCGVVVAGLVAFLSLLVLLNLKGS